MKTKIIDKKWAPWATDDDAFIQNARVIGRGRLSLVGGGVIHALLIEHGEDGGPREVRAVYLNRETGNFETVGGLR